MRSALKWNQSHSGSYENNENVENVRLDEDGVPIQLVGTHADTTEDREKDQALRKLKKEVEKLTIELKNSNRQLETILNGSSDSIWVCDGNGIILTINKAAEKISNIKKTNIIGKNIKELESKGIIDRSVTLAAIKNRRTISRIQKLKKTERQLLVTATPVFNDNDEITIIVVNERDLTHLNQLKDKLEKAQKATSRYKEELTSLHLKELKEQGIVAQSKEMIQVIAIAGKLARCKASPVLILGESGTGKGLLAKFIHNQSHSFRKPFVQINCAALPEHLLEAELFGYEKGAFTGALDQGKIGLFEMASGGTLFLDELGDMSPGVQAKLLKCIEEKEIMRLGGLEPIKLECTVIAATNLDLKAQVQHKKFRQDLFFRLNPFTITLPPLRHRPEDLFEMIMLFVKKYNAQYNVKCRLSFSCLKKLECYPFPGNVRELKNILKKAVVMGEEEIMDDLDSQPWRPADVSAIANIEASLGDLDTQHSSFQQKLLNYEKLLINQALDYYDSTRSLAKCLKLSQSSVVRKLKIHGLAHRLRKNAQSR